MKRIIVFSLLLMILLSACAPAIQLDTSTTVTRTGTVTDRAMATPNGGHKIWDTAYPYVGIAYEDGTVVCLWNKMDIKIPEEISIGDTVEVTYRLQSGTDLWILTNIKEVG